jgi:hypothetical protein
MACLLGACAAPAAREPGPSLGYGGVKELGNKVGEVYRSARYLSFTSVITETRKEPNGQVIGPSEKARATVAMAQGGKLRLTAIDSASDRQVLERVCDGTLVTDRYQDQQNTFPSSEGGDVHIEADFDFCYIGTLLQSWIGIESHKPALFEERIGNGTHQGVQATEERPCEVVVYERKLDNNFLVRDTFFIDRKHYFVRQWTTMQAELSDSGEIASHITRQRRYTNIRTTVLPAATFTAPLPSKID